MAIYKGIEVDKQLQPLLPHMQQVEGYRESLQALQAVWDNLNLLGHLSGTTTEMAHTRASFSSLTSNLLNNLAACTLARRVQDISAKAQVAIDILVRNLFERTADIGFLATDESIRQFAANPGAAHAINGRFRAYVEKYSVYADVVLLSPSGEVLARLAPHSAVRCTEPFVREALSTQAAYVEAYGPSALFDAPLPSLIYAYRVHDGRGNALGVLALCFNLADEMQRIFSNLARAGDWSVITLLDARNAVIASSDPYLIPVGARLDVGAGDGQILRFAGRSYLATRRATHGYQGYAGPGWSALVLVPLEYAFADDADAPRAALPANLIAAILNGDTAFPPETKRIPAQAERIQRELERSVWNGNVRQSVAAQASSNPAFAKILLAEISRTGLRMKEVFAQSIGNLQETVVSSWLDDCRFLARLAIDIMDRNLYERANDCRWWALDPVLCNQLEHGTGTAQADRLGERLSSINDLYTVYDNLVIFDTAGTVLAVSRTQVGERVGTHLDAAWAGAALTLANPAHYAVSDFAPTPLYGGRPSYIYTAALFGSQGQPVGGIGIVFDSAPQFSAMLQDALPAHAPGAFGLFVDPAGRVIASSDERFTPGQSVQLPADLLTAAASGEGESRLIAFAGQVMAVGARLSSGYREYKGEHDPYRNAVIALIFVPLGEHTADATPAAAPPASSYGLSGSAAAQSLRTAASVEIATFHVGNHWLGLPIRDVVEAVELSNFTRLPNAPPQIFGSMIYQSAAIPLYNLRVALGLNDSKLPEDMQVVVINSADGKQFGLLVDHLGDIPEVPLDHIEPVSNLFVGITPVLASIVKSATPGGSMLTLLSVASMYALLKDF